MQIMGLKPNTSTFIFLLEQEEMSFEQELIGPYVPLFFFKSWKHILMLLLVNECMKANFIL